MTIAQISVAAIDDGLVFFLFDYTESKNLVIGRYGSVDTIFGVVNPYQHVKDDKHVVGDDRTGFFGDQRNKPIPLQEQSINGTSIVVSLTDIVDSWGEGYTLSEISTRRRPEDNGSTFCHENQITAQKRVKDYCQIRSSHQTEVNQYFNSIFQT